MADISSQALTMKGKGEILILSWQMLEAQKGGEENEVIHMHMEA